MAADRYTDSLKFGKCGHCGLMIWRYPDGFVWRTADRDSACAKSLIGIHVNSVIPQQEKAG